MLIRYNATSHTFSEIQTQILIPLKEFVQDIQTGVQKRRFFIIRANEFENFHDIFQVSWKSQKMDLQF